MQFLRIGEKVISKEKLNKELNKILELRTKGITQEGVARKLGVERTFVSRLESLGEIRKGNKIALIGFPIKNKEEIAIVAEELGIEYILLFTQEERFEFIQKKGKSELFDEIMEIIVNLADFDLIIFLGSDMRVPIVEKIFSVQVIGIVIGHSPIKESKYVNPEKIIEIVKQVKN
ncbi:MAG TPA: XRE family transcriptional regulator [Candidatus Atribacteria bacterium]|nr:XRE family transcriptional regulator [Candidatus Atribacteria bacterium]